MVALPKGIRIDKYVITGVLGAGGFGITYLAEDVSLHKKFAIKEYFPQTWANRDATDSVSLSANTGANSDYQWGLDRFLEEARTLAKFRHPAIVNVNSILEANNTAYMVLDYEEGMDFRRWLEKQGRPPTQDELDAILRPLLDALELIHKNGILHRDIAPDNIYIRNDGTPVLLDFGAAREALGQRTQTLSAIVKSGYSPQEQYSTAGRDQGAWTDIYALGATLYRAVTGEAPPESVQRSLRDEYVPARERAKGEYREGFLHGIDRALQLHPAARPQSITEWRDDLFGDKPGARRKPPISLRFGPKREAPKPGVQPGANPGLTGGGALPLLALAAVGVAVLSGGAYYFAVYRPKLEQAQPVTRQQQQPQQRITDRRQDPNPQRDTNRIVPQVDPGDGRNELAAWDRARSENTVQAYRLYLSEYPNGQFATDARERIAALEPRGPQNDPHTGGRQDTDPLANVSEACRRGHQEWRTKSSFGAFAVEDAGACGWSWGYKTEEEARNAALDQCRKHGPNCRVIEVHRDNKGDWTLSDACRRDLEDWQKRPGRSAFAVERRGGCGWAYGYGTLKEARSRALVQCQKQGPDCKIVHTK